MVVEAPMWTRKSGYQSCGQPCPPIVGQRRPSDRQTRERVFDIFHEAEGPRPEMARIAGDTLEIVWQGSGHVTRHGLDWLAA